MTSGNVDMRGPVAAQIQVKEEADATLCDEPRSSPAGCHQLAAVQLPPDQHKPLARSLSDVAGQQQAGIATIHGPGVQGGLAAWNVGVNESSQLPLATSGLHQPMQPGASSSAGRDANGGGQGSVSSGGSNGAGDDRDTSSHGAQAGGRTAASSMQRTEDAAADEAAANSLLAVAGGESPAARMLTAGTMSYTVNTEPPNADTPPRRGPRTPSCPYKGVSLYKRTKRWEAHIWHQGELACHSLLACMSDIRRTRFVAQPHNTPHSRHMSPYSHP